MRSDVLVLIVLVLILGTDSSRATRLPDDVLARATTRRLLWPEYVALRAGVLFCCALRATTRRPFVPVFVALRALVFPDAVGRGTTRRCAPIFVVFTTVSIRFDDCEGETPGFKFVRILLFIYGYI